ncbi:MAG: uroporphyrinogen-III synthase [Candidatus Methanomethylophilaceae archaeon]|nr:uroporphyrinogen-III synthase [Candidatus Methanomethylophilaceae archaeon]
MTVRVAFTRPEDKIPESLRLAESMGMSAMAAPSLRITEGAREQFDAAKDLLGRGSVDFAVFGSGTAVEACSRRWGDERLASLFSGCRVVSIGPHTSDVLRKHGVTAGMMPQDDYSSYGVVDMLSGLVSGRRVMLVRSDSGSDVLVQGLEEAGAEVLVFQSYRLEEAGETPELLKIFDALEAGDLDAMAFTSPMSASVFIERMRERFGVRADSILDSAAIAAIGRPTSLRLEELGHPPRIVPGKTTFKDMLQACLDVLDG